MTPILMLINSCSTQKDAWPNRAYHQLNTKYNGLFYAEKYLEEGVKKIHNLHQDNYKKILNLNKYGSLENAKNAQASFDQAIEKSRTAIQQHSMDIKGEEKNKLIDNSYMVIGRAQFYKQDYAQAINTFSHIVRKSNNPEKQSEALLWATLCHQELDNKESLRKNILLLEEDYYLNKKQDIILDEIQASIAIKEEYFAEAIYHLKKIQDKTKDKNKKHRIYYMLGQLNLLLEEPNLSESYDAFTQVIRKSSDYDMIFNAKIMRVKAYAPNIDVGQENISYDKLKKELEQMLNDDKNIDYKDQIYFSLAGLALKTQDTLSTINYLKLSTATSIYNDDQKLESHWLLANIFWDKKEYTAAYHRSDSAYQLASNTRSDYLEIKNMRRSSKKVAVQYNIIHQNDSLIALAKLPEQQRNDIIDQYIATLKQQEEEQKETNERPGSNFNSYEFNRQSQNSMNIASGGGWYFYNPSAISLGYSEFLSRWGNRKLEDNWRRKNKNQVISDEDEIGLNGEEGSGPTEKQKYSRDYYINQLPIQPEDQLLLLAKTEAAYYDLGGIFKEDLEDYGQAILTYNQLIERFPSTDYKQLIYFDLYNIYNLKGDSEGADVFMNKIKKEYPNSDYLRALSGDTMLTTQLTKEAQIYKEAYSLYTTFSEESCGELKKLMKQNKTNMFIAEIELLNAFCQAQNSNKKQFIENLEIIRKKYPKTTVSNKVDTIVLVLKGELDFAPQSLYQNDFESEHYFILSIEETSINLPDLQASISNFNNKNYRLDSLETNNLLLNKNTQLLKVGRFKNKEKALAYQTLIQQDPLTNNTIIQAGIRLFVISEKNYKTLLKEKNINDYLSYFNEIYLLN